MFVFSRVFRYDTHQMRVLLLVGLVFASLLPSSIGGIAEDRIAAKKAHEARMEKQMNFHANGGNDAHDHKGHPGHGGEHMNEIDLDTHLEYHERHHHENGETAVQHRLPQGQHDIPEHLRPDKDQRGDHHNPPEMRHVIPEHQHDFGIDVHTGKQRITSKDIKEHVWNKRDPDHPHAHLMASKRMRRRKFKDHPLRKYDWMEEESNKLAHEHQKAVRAGDNEAAEELAHKKKEIDRELRHLDMLHHGMSEEEYVYWDFCIY